jgi:uncharacterized DUF497 family protein
MITYDENKRQENIAKHGLDFVGCEAIFDGPVFSRYDDRETYGEQRTNVLGFLNNIVVHLTYTERGNDLHVISLRKATKHEIQVFAKGLPI